MNKELLAWGAGVIEGEGSFFLHLREHERRQDSAKVVVAMTDRDILERLQKIFAAGHIYTRKNNGLGKKPLWVWAVQVREDVLNCLQLVYPWLGTRRRAKAAQILNHFSRGVPIHAYPYL